MPQYHDVACATEAFNPMQLLLYSDRNVFIHPGLLHEPERRAPPVEKVD